MRNMSTIKRCGFLMLLPSTLLVAGLTGCSIVHLTGDPPGTPPLKQAVDETAVTAVGFGTSKHGSTQGASRDAGGIWHWTEVDQSGNTLQCEGPKVGVPTRCDPGP
jgi:hypothetical protein